MIEFLKLAEKIKSNKRYSATPEMKEKESSADHSWKLALMVYVLTNELGVNIDVSRAIKIALIHDLTKAITGDFDYRDIVNKKITEEEKNRQELEAIAKVVESFPPKTAGEIAELWHEHDDNETPEAKFVKAVDKLEVMSHLVSRGYECFDLPDVIATFADKSVAQVPELKNLLSEIKAELKKEFIKGGFDWKKEYDQ